jgi:hypothetical protein
MTALKYLGILVALLAGGILLAMIADFAIDHDAQLISARQAWAPESTNRPVLHGTSVRREISRTGALGAGSPPNATVQEAQHTSVPPTGPVQKGSPGFAASA